MPVIAPADKRSYEFTVEGLYYGAHGDTGNPVVKKYTAQFILPSQEAALSVICKHLLNPYLRQKYPDFVRYRTHSITNMAAHGRKPDPAVLQMAIEDMNVRELSDFCLLKQIFIDPYKYSDLPLVREKIAKVYHDRLNQQKANATSGQAKEDAEVNELLDLNKLPKLPKDGAVPISHNEQRVGAALAGGKQDVRVTTPDPTVGLTSAETTDENTDNLPSNVVEEPVDNKPKDDQDIFA